MGRFCRLFVLLVPCVLAAQTTPGGEEQDRILGAMHSYADQYVSNLPNFLCTQTTERWDAGLKGNHWHLRDTLVTNLSYNHGQERRSVALVNGKPVGEARAPWRTTLTTEGEFGTLINQVLGSDGQATFTWNRWESVGGRRLAVFDFAVDQQHSTLRLRLSDLATAVIPYAGSVYADPVTGAVWRISHSSSEIPPVLRTRQISTTISYTECPVGAASYLLPTEAEVLLLLPSGRIRNDIAFTGYRKFTADSVITFESGEGAHTGTPQN